MVRQCRADRGTRQATFPGNSGAAAGRAYNLVVAGHALRDLLNRLRWDRVTSREGVVVEIRERNETGEGMRALPFAAFVEILTHGVTLADGTFIPYHRIFTVRRGDEVLWRASRRDHGEA